MEVEGMRERVRKVGSEGWKVRKGGREGEGGDGR